MLHKYLKTLASSLTITNKNDLFNEENMCTIDVYSFSIMFIWNNNNVVKYLIQIKVVLNDV